MQSDACQAQAAGQPKPREPDGHKRFGAFMRQDGATVARSTVGLSGRPLAAVGPRITVEVAPRGKRRRTRTGDNEADSEEEAEIRRVERGESANQRGQWTIDRVMEVRRVYPAAGKGRRRYLEVRVRWKGLDPTTGAPWADSWSRLSETRADGTIVQLLNAAAAAEARRLEKIKYGAAVPRAPRTRRKRTRSAAQNEEDERWAMHWGSRLRSRGGSVDAPVARRRRRIAEEESEEDGAA